MSDFVIRNWTLEPYDGEQAPRHVHHNGDEAFIVLEGMLRVEVDGTDNLLEPGGMHLIPAGSVHTFATIGDQPVRVLCVMTPEIDRLIHSLHDPAERDSDEVWEKHHSALAD
jgi:quercetin dioxygenase-like cupin family protein